MPQPTDAFANFRCETATLETLTPRYTERAVKFIEANKGGPFFLYFPHTFPHTPLFASEQFRGKSPRGRYGDVVEELDWSVGQLLSKLKKLGLDDRTFIAFTSDNGPWLSKGTNAGSAGPLRPAVGAGERSNKGMKLTSAERIGRSQLIPGVGRTVRELRGWFCPQRPVLIDVAEGA